jgi:hypothetical protein
LQSGNTLNVTVQDIHFILSFVIRIPALISFDVTTGNRDGMLNGGCAR